MTPPFLPFPSSLCKNFSNERYQLFGIGLTGRTRGKESHLLSRFFEGKRIKICYLPSAIPKSPQFPTFAPEIKFIWQLHQTSAVV